MLKRKRLKKRAVTVTATLQRKAATIRLAFQIVYSETKICTSLLLIRVSEPSYQVQPKGTVGSELLNSTRAQEK